MKKPKLFLSHTGAALLVAVLTFAAGMSVPASVRADDTEVFFPPATTSGSSSVNPNILFVIDTSGSMDSDDGFTDANGNPLSRLRRVQIAFRQIMAEFSSTVNVGVERFSDEQGGPILFPVQPIDSKPFGSIIQLNYTDSGTCSNEAEQRIGDGTVRCPGIGTSFSLRLGSDYDKIYEEVDNRDEAEEWQTGLKCSNVLVLCTTLLSSVDTNPKEQLTDAAASGTAARCSGDLDLTYDPAALSILLSNCQGFSVSTISSLTGGGPKNQTVGIRFPGIDVPKTATIRFSSLTVTDNGEHPGGTPTINIYGEKKGASVQFTGAPHTADVSDPFKRPLTTNFYPWQPAVGSAGTPFFSATAVSGSTPQSYANSATNANLKDLVQELIQFNGSAAVSGGAPAFSGWAMNDPITLVTKGPNLSANQRAVYGINTTSTNGSDTPVNNRPKLAIVFDATTGSLYPNDVMTGIRFLNVRIPRGAVVSKATIEFHNAEAVDDRSLTLNIKAEKIGESPAFLPSNTVAPYNTVNNSAGLSNISNRTPTSAVVSWPVEAWTAPYGSYSTPSLTALVNEVAAQSSWCGGNDMAFTFTYVSGDGARNSVSANLNTKYAPVLHLELDTSQDAYTTGCVNSSATQQISSSSDDAQEDNSGGMATAGTALSLGCSNATKKCPGTNNTKVGTRFSGLNIPQGATIQSAFIDFTSNGGDTGVLPLTVHGEKVTNSAAFTNLGSNISNRISSNPTSATVSWTPTDWTDGTLYSTSDLKTILQEMVNQSGWTTSSAATFIFDGNGRHRAYSWDGSAGNAPKIRVTYQGAAGGTSTTTVRQYLPDLVDSFSATGYTPTVGALYEAARYYRGEAAYYGRTRGGGYVNGDKLGEPPSDADLLSVSSDRAMVAGTTAHSLPAGCTTSNLKSASCTTETWTGTPLYQTPITDGCQGSNIVLLSDGFPNQTSLSDGNTTPKSQVQTMIGKTCQTYKNSSGVSQPDWTCGPDLTQYLNTVDQISSTASGAVPGLTGSQTVRTYTIGFGADVASGGSDSNGAEFLTKLSQNGGGTYNSAQSADSLVAVFRSIVANILNINTTFVAPAVTVNTFNQLTDRNELYFAVFKPGTNVDWRGNLKRYQLAQQTNDTSVQIYDNSSPPLLAVDSTTGFFKDSTKSFWSAAVDGSDVAKGGAASVLTNTRNVYTYVSSSAPSSVTLSGVASNRVQSSNTTLNPADTASTATKTAANALLGLPSGALNVDRSAVLDWAAGIDVNDDNGNGSVTDARTQLGDPLHSEPQLITYGISSTSPAPPAEQIPDIAIFMGTNDGGLHAFNALDGTEYFSFIPQELLPHLNNYYADNGSYQTRGYGMDGPVTAWINDANGNSKLYSSGTLESGEFAYVYAGMRRGGRNYYALDVTNRSAPVYKFQIKGGTANTSYVELGQTWSRAVHARIRVDATSSGAKDVLIFTGGYDPNVDGQSGGAVQPDAQGRALYVADASTGALLWWAGFNDTTTGNTIHPNLSVSQMIYSVPASPAAIDLDNDGYIDRIYIADAGGQIFRFILGTDTTTGLRNLGNASVQYVAKLSGTTVTNAHRFYGALAAGLITDNTANPYIALAIGSGFREHPLDVNNEDRFYVIRDPDTANNTNANRTIKDIVNSSTTPYVSYASEATSTPDLYDATANYVGAVCAAGDTTCTTNKAAATAALGTATAQGTGKGFYIKLVDSAGALQGEKVISSAVLSRGQIFFSSFQPGGTSSNACSAVKGISRLYQINVNDGTPANVLVTSNNTVVTVRAITLNIGGLPPNPIIVAPSINTYIGTDGQQHVCTGSNCITGDSEICVGAVCTKLTHDKFFKYSWQKIEN